MTPQTSAVVVSMAWAGRLGADRTARRTVARVAGMLLAVPGGVLAMIGAMNSSAAALVGWSLVGAGAGVLVAVGAPRLRRGRQVGVSGPDVPTGVAATAAFIAAYLVITGLLAAFGGGLTAAVLILLAIAGLRAGHRDRPGLRDRPAAGPNAHDVLALATLPASSVPVAEMATEDLCVAWRRSYFLLFIATDDPAHQLVVQRRQDFLDEIERRDRPGFLRWLDSGAKAGGDPAPYLTTRG
ncbi:hypothetical protein [Amycolatopsis sp. lyj-109]|uniref:hypothetical protein n=1 Tax=Amycolatopsis sp. lyj-109 TaxID=2789287 RepID=UPI0039780866